MTREQKIRGLEIKLVEKRVELVELQTKSFSLWWRTMLYNIKYGV